MRKGIWSEAYGDGAGAGSTRIAATCSAPTSKRSPTGSTAAQAAVDDARAFFRGELKTLDTDLRSAAARATDRATRLHLEDVRMQIARALDPAVTESGPAGVRALNDLSDFDVSVDPLACWVDYAIPGSSRPAAYVQPRIALWLWTWASGSSGAACRLRAGPSDA